MQNTPSTRFHRQSSNVMRLGAVALLGLAVAGCTTSQSPQAVNAASEQRVTQSDLEVFCPRVTLREGTAFINNYEKGGQDDASRLVYQATISDVTRDCRRNNGQLALTIAAAGRVVPGPKFHGGSVSLPIRVTVMEGERVVSNTVHRQNVAMNNQTATQFLFTAPLVNVAEATARQVQIFVGFDSGKN